MLVLSIGLVVFSMASLLVAAVVTLRIDDKPEGNDDGDDWRWRKPSPADPPPRPLGDGPIDWGQFDRLREHWERPPVRWDGSPARVG